MSVAAIDDGYEDELAFSVLHGGWVLLKPLASRGKYVCSWWVPCQNDLRCQGRLCTVLFWLLREEEGFLDMMVRMSLYRQWHRTAWPVWG